MNMLIMCLHNVKEKSHNRLILRGVFLNEKNNVSLIYIINYVVYKKIYKPWSLLYLENMFLILRDGFMVIIIVSSGETF